jgi:hypothetical protein
MVMPVWRSSRFFAPDRRRLGIGGRGGGEGEHHLGLPGGVQLGNAASLERCDRRSGTDVGETVPD